MTGRAILVVLDGVGVGAAPDAAEYGDTGANTLAHALGSDLRLPFLESLGLGRILGCSEGRPVRGAWGRIAEQGWGKDTVVGHWRLAGQVVPRPLPTYPDGFPEEVISEFIRRTGAGGILGNRPASGTVIIEELGAEHLRTGWPIVYTSADSVFQIAAHEERVGLKCLYRWCETARRILTPPHDVGRVIARPFTGRPGSFRRTAARRDYPLPPPAPTIIDILAAAGRPVVSVGKIEDIFAGRGISESHRTGSNTETLAELESAVAGGRGRGGLIFANLNDFDTVYGHRRDVAGFRQALVEADAGLKRIAGHLRPDDLLIIVADHGCDPTFAAHTDHTREYVPVLLYGGGVPPDARLGDRTRLADVGATVASYLGVAAPPDGADLLAEVGAPLAAGT